MDDSEKARIYVSAFICTDVIVDQKNGLLSAIRIASVFNAFPAEATLHEPGSAQDSRTVMVFAPIMCRVVIHVYSDNPCRFRLTLRDKRPDGSYMNPTASQTGCYEIEGGAQGLTLDVALTLAADSPGTHWVEVMIDEELVTKWPLLIIHPTAAVVPETDHDAQNQPHPD